MAESSLAEALGTALTGEVLPVTAGEPGMLVEELASLGWDRDRLLALRRQRQLGRLPWPFPVPLERRREIGFARFDARLADLCAVLGLGGMAVTAVARRRPLDADERRLEADRPPHWG